jgi:hypothetical protein
MGKLSLVKSVAEFVIEGHIMKVPPQKRLNYWGLEPSDRIRV